MIDLRSDTVTKPTPEMRAFMLNAEVGDDVFGDDPSIKELEALGASLFGKEAGLYCASGTMTNQIAINVHTQPGDEVLCHEEAHIYRYEGGGMARNSGVSARFVSGRNGLINPDEIAAKINPDDPHYPVTRLVSIEDTCNRGGGVYYDFATIQRIGAICKEHNLKFHLDGARAFNALEETKVSPKDYGRQFDSLSICLSKGLGAPVGSLLLGDAEFIHQARRIRKVFGGGMRQVGIIAAGGIYALKHNISRLKDDHIRAKAIQHLLLGKDWVKSVLPVRTNIVVAILKDGLNERKVAGILKEKSILCVPFGKGRLRFVTHLGINEEDLEALKKNLPHTLSTYA